MSKKTTDNDKLSDDERNEVLKQLDKDGTAVEIAEAMIAVDPSKETKKAADKLLEEADSSANQ